MTVVLCVCVWASGEVMEKSYLGNVSCVALNSQYAAALYDGHILLHMVLVNVVNFP